MDKEELHKMANRYINIAYIMAGCLTKAAESMDELLRKCNADLNQSNRKQMNTIIDLSKRLTINIEILEKMSILRCDDDAIFAHDNVQDQYYALLLRIIEITGSDNFGEVRAYCLYKHLCHLQENIQLPGMDHAEKIAFYGIASKIYNGEFDADEVKHCLKMKEGYESGTETPEGKA